MAARAAIPTAPMMSTNRAIRPFAARVATRTAARR